MLVELAVRNLGVIAESRIPLLPGLTAVTGETGAGKTMVVEALGLLGGGRADPARVRAGATEAVIEGMFVEGPDDSSDQGVDDAPEHVLRRHVPASGRSRSYVDGALSTAGELAAVGAAWIEIHGQHAQMALAQPRHQREALDRFARIDLTALVAARQAVADLERRLESLGGDERARALEIDLLRFQVDEIEAVGPVPGEEERLAGEEDVLADAVAHRDAAYRSIELIGADGAALDSFAAALDALRGRAPFEALVRRLDDVVPELHDVLGELRDLVESIEPDDERLAEIRGRRQRIVELRRKYGEDIDEVLAHQRRAASRLEDLESLDATRADVLAELDAARAAAAAAAGVVGAARREAAPRLAAALVEVLSELALPTCRVEVAVVDHHEDDGAGDDVEILISTNPGAPLGGIGRVASGGELSRVMLALRLVLSGGPDVMVFDEVDAGVGGEAATSVGRALARLAADRQVLVVTHLPQVAAFADQHLLVSKEVVGSSTVTVVESLDDDGRVVELSRMMTGRPGSTTARDHAEELLATSSGRRVRG
ncbi:MAG: DNA repair protein RecN [Actinobacteria bacterium]|nr:DNA repair protein RecN [Actinomycetota bacterium]